MTANKTITKTETYVCRLNYKKVDVDVSLDALSELFSKLDAPSILGGNVAKKENDKFSYWTEHPKETFTFNMEQTKPFERLEKVLGKYKLDQMQKAELPKGIFKGGWIGYFAYELGRYIEKLPDTAVDDIKMPLIYLNFYDRFICYDHEQKCFWLIALEIPDDSESTEQKLDLLASYLDKAKDINVYDYKDDSIQDIDPDTLRCNMTKQYYLETIEKIRRYIYDGVVYQVNFSQRFDCDYDTDPAKLFHWENRHNPSGYSAYISTDDFAIVSASPELFVSLIDGWISTKPIKGTRKRLPENCDENMRINKEKFHELVYDEKEQAELNMIIDLERNDLVRICQYGTRTVTQPRTIETYPTVYHAVATVSGQLRENITMSDILKGIFPGGSISGAPKVSSLEIIDETEPTCRGIYTGSIGFISIDGTVCLNIAIRTIIIKDKIAYVQTGGGIVADSDPDAEWDETITKARALIAGIDSVQRGV
jgi:para-aminobenzoate synthetase component 1